MCHLIYGAHYYVESTMLRVRKYELGKGLLRFQFKMSSGVLKTDEKRMFGCS